MVNTQGDITNTETVLALCGDPVGQHFPWTACTLIDLIEGPYQNSEGQTYHWQDFARLDAVGFLHGASRCHWTQSFADNLLKTYQNVNRDRKRFEVIYISSDHDVQSYDAMRKKFSWLAVPYHEHGRIQDLKRILKLNQRPCLHILDAEGKTITHDGEAAVLGDPQGLACPWKPELVREFFLDPGCVHRGPCLVFFLEMVEVGLIAQYLREIRANVNSEMASLINVTAVLNSSGMSTQLRNILGMDAATKSCSRTPEVSLFDFTWHTGPSFFECPETNHMSPSLLGPFLTQLVTAFLNKRLTATPFSTPSHLQKARVLTKKYPR